ncbi:hypothetical protein [Terrisporobacter sp.]|uniref:hypothetical protein n=1 Tax=Terrisporobacter sp. TaxID=1965305 RepID=UPI00399190FB
MKKSDLINLIGIIVGIIGIITTTISIGLALLGGSQGNCNIGNITVGDGGEVNISCTVAP